jgi:hypothetical protein
LMVNIGFDGRHRQSLSRVNQRIKFAHNPGVPARNEFADISCATTEEYRKPTVRARSWRDPGLHSAA